MPWMKMKMNERNFPSALLGQLETESWSFYGLFTRVAASEDAMVKDPFSLKQNSMYDVEGWTVSAVTIYQTYPPHVDTVTHFIESMYFDIEMEFTTTRGGKVYYTVYYDPVTTELTIPVHIDYADYENQEKVICILQVDVHLQKGAEEKVLTFSTEDYPVGGEIGFFHVASEGTVKIFINGEGMKPKERTIDVEFPLRFAVVEHFMLQTASKNKLGLAKCGYFHVLEQDMKEMIGGWLPINSTITFTTQEEQDQYMEQLCEQFQVIVENKLMYFFKDCLDEQINRIGVPVWFTYTFDEYYGPRVYYENSDQFYYKDHFYRTPGEAVAGALDIENFINKSTQSPYLKYAGIIQKIIQCKQAWEAAELAGDTETMHEVQDEAREYYRQLSKDLSDMIFGMYYTQVQSWLDGLTKFSNDFEFQTNQSPIIPMALRKMIENTEITEVLNWKFPYEINWWKDTEILVQGHYTGEYFFFVLKDDEVPVYNNTYFVPTTPFYFGTFNTYFDRTEGIWKGWPHNVAFFGGTCNLDDLTEWYKYLATIQQILNLGDQATPAQLVPLYKKLPDSIAKYMKETAFEDLQEWWVKNFDLNYFEVQDEKEIWRQVHYIPVFGGKTISPINRGYDSDPMAGDGIHDVIVKKDIFQENYRSHFFTWNTPGNNLPPVQFDDLLKFDEGLTYERVGGRPDKLAYDYQYNPSRYEGCARGSHANICGQYGTLGRIPNVVFTNPLSLCGGDILSVVHPLACGEEVDFSFQYITCPYSPLTYPFWVDPYPCIELPIYEPEIPPEPLPDIPDGANSPACLKVLLRWDAPSKYHMEAYVIANKDKTLSCSTEHTSVHGDNNLSMQCMSPYSVHNTSDDWDTRPVEFWLAKKEGLTYSIFVMNWSTFIFGYYYKNPLNKVYIEIVDDQVGRPYWMSSQEYNDTDNILLKTYQVPSNIISGISGKSTKENGLVYVCDVVIGPDNQITFIDKMIPATKALDYNMGNMLNL